MKEGFFDITKTTKKRTKILFYDMDSKNCFSFLPTPSKSALVIPTKSISKDLFTMPIALKQQNYSLINYFYLPLVKVF